jgi:Big-like domain-containing protein
MRRPHRSLLPIIALALSFAAGASGAGSSGPVITGTPQVGSTLTADVSGLSAPAATFTYQWKRCNVHGNGCADMAHATASTYRLGAVDVGSRLRVAVTGSNRQTAISEPTAVVAPAPAPALDPTKANLRSSIADGARLSGSVQWIVDATGSVARIDFFIDGAKRWTEAYAPYQFNGDPDGKLDTKTLSDGAHTLLAVASGSSGTELGRLSAGVTVANGGSGSPPPPPPPPAVTLANSIANGATISGAVQWTAAATGFGIVRVDFSIDGTKRWTEQQAPYQFNGDPSGLLDTTTLANGSHTLLAVAFNSNSVELARASSTVTVSNTTSSPPPPPPPPPSPPPSGGWARYGTANGWKLPFRSATDQDFEIGQDVALGAKYVRIGPNDAIIQKLLAKGITPIILFGGNPSYPWTTTPQQLASQAAGYASRWGNRIMYECLNELNIHGWTPDAYVPYLNAFHDAVKAAAPSATVLMNGLWTGSGSQALVPWTERFIALGGLAETDLYNVHLYDDAAEHGAWSMWDMTFGSGGAGYYDAKNVRSMVNAWTAARGRPAMPIVSTESGGPVPKYSEAKQATIVTNALRAADGAGTGYRKLAFTLVYNVLDDDVAGFGLLRPDRSKRPAWDAFRTVATG